MTRHVLVLLAAIMVAARAGAVSANAGKVETAPVSAVTLHCMHDWMQAVERYNRKYANHGPHEFEVTIPDPSSVR